MDRTIEIRDGKRHIRLLNDFDGDIRQVVWLLGRLASDGDYSPYKSREQMVGDLVRILKLKPELLGRVK